MQVGELAPLPDGAEDIRRAAQPFNPDNLPTAEDASGLQSLSGDAGRAPANRAGQQHPAVVEPMIEMALVLATQRPSHLASRRMRLRVVVSTTTVDSLLLR